MRAANSLAANSLWMVLSRFAAQGLTVIFTVVLARRLGISGFGEYAFIAALIYVANSLTTFGTDMVVIRQIAAHANSSGLPAALVLQLVLSALLIVAVWLYGPRIPNQSPEAVQALKVYILSLIPLAFFTVFSTALRGLQRLGAYAFLNLVVPALQVGIVLMPRIQLGALCAFLLGVQVIAALIAGWMCNGLVAQLWRQRRRAVPDLPVLMKACAPLVLLTVLGISYQRLSIYMLSTMTNPTDTGLFSAAARTLEATKTAHLAVLAALYPAMALAGSPSAQAGLARSIRASRNVLLAGGAAGALILFAFAGPLIRLLYGGEYQPSEPILRVLAWTLIPFTINSYLTLSFVAAHREWFVGRALAVSLVALFILNLWQIPAEGALGSAWAVLIAESIQAAALLMSVQHRWASQGGTCELPHLSG